MLGKCIDTTIWFSTIIITFAYIFPALGMTHAYAPFVAIGAIVSASFWDIWGTSMSFIADIEGNKTINYFLTLPIPNSLLLIKQTFGYALKAGIPALIVLPLTKLLLWNKISFAHFSLIRFVIIFILTNLFVGVFSLVITSSVHSIQQVTKIGIRFLFPMWFLSGSNYPWQTLHTVSPNLAYLSLANPLLYAMEGVHAAVLDPRGYLPFSICAIMLTLFTIFFTWLGHRQLKKRLDFV